MTCLLIFLNELLEKLGATLVDFALFCLIVINIFHLVIGGIFTIFDYFHLDLTKLVRLTQVIYKYTNIYLKTLRRAFDSVSGNKRQYIMSHFCCIFSWLQLWLAGRNPSNQGQYQNCVSCLWTSHTERKRAKKKKKVCQEEMHSPTVYRRRKIIKTWLWFISYRWNYQLD